MSERLTRINMYIKEIDLQNFRNYNVQKVQLDKGINIFYGDNAQGKTNLLEAIFLCSIGKSFRTNKDKELINFNKDYADIEISYEKKDRSGKINLRIDDKKRFLVNNVPVKKTSEIIGNIYIVLFTPDDINILKNGPSKRRRFLDIMISQLRPKYIYSLNQYNKIIAQRNAYLKQIKFSDVNYNLLDIWDENLSIYGEKIHNYREEFIKKIIDKINYIHGNITNKNEKIDIQYIYNFKDRKDFLEKLKNNRNLDIKTGMTNAGIQREDFVISINGKKLNLYGSQGQHRTAVLSLKITELEIIKDELEEKPILLLDDFMSELDSKRRLNLLDLMENNQVIITCTEKGVFDKQDINAKYFYVDNGIIK